MLNSVLEMLEKRGFFNYLGEAKTLSFIQELIQAARSIDCNTGEILEEIGVRLGICYYCLEYSKKGLEENYGICQKCSDG
jgi:hypothetical protein